MEPPQIGGGPMTEITWFTVIPPRGLDTAKIAGLMRVLAGRPRYGLTKVQPVVVFELWIEAGHVRWLLGMDSRISGQLPGELIAQIPALALVPVAYPSRSEPITAREVRFSTLSHPFRLDTAEAVAAGLFQLNAQLRVSEAAALQWVVGPSQRFTNQPQQFTPLEYVGLVKPRELDAGEQRAWQQKVSEPLFGVRGRIGAAAADPKRASVLLRSLLGAVELANGPRANLWATHQSSRTAEQLITVIGRPRSWAGMVNAAELAMLVGWPIGNVVVPGRPATTGRPPRVLLRSVEGAAKQPGAAVLGQSLHSADAGQLVTMPSASRRHHLALTGPTGSGKSTVLCRLAVAAAQAGQGVLVMEPRGDLVEDIIARLPKSRHDDLVVIDPADADQAGFNPLAGPVSEAERRADELVGLFRELFGTAIGPRSADVLLHGLLTVARLDDGTLADVPVLLSNPAFRRQVLAKTSDPLVLAPWWAWFNSTSDGEKQQIIAPVLNKLRAFLSRQPIRRMLGQANPKFSLDELFMNRPRVVLVNLNQGVIGPESARLLGSLLLSSAWNAIQRRARLPRNRRYPVDLIVDEFQTFVGALDFGDVLAQCRGLAVSVTVAHQHLHQLSPALQAAVAANARSRLAFRPSQDDVKPLANLFGPSVAAADLERLGAFQACVRLLHEHAMTEAFTVATLPLPPAGNDPARLRSLSRARFATDGAALDEALRQRWQGGSPAATAIGVTPRRTP
jgi:hypothetical protein